jgi:hypothetical protein
MGTGDLGVVVGGAAQIERLDVADDRGRTDAEAGFGSDSGTRHV